MSCPLAWPKPAVTGERGARIVPMGSKLPARLIAVAVGKFHNTDAAFAPANCTLPFRNTAEGPMTLITTAEVDGALILT